MKEKIINYIETLEAKSLQVDDYFKQRNELYIENQKKDKEIERLNNIINELEKGIKENIEELEEHQLSRDRIDEDKEILRFLQELKGSDK